MNVSMSLGSFSAATTPRHHHRFRNPVSCYRLRRYRSPGTPLLRWKFDYRHGGYGGVAVSARKLAAGLWQLRLWAEISDFGIRIGSCDRLRCQPRTGHGNIALSFRSMSRGYGVGIMDLQRSPLLGHSSSHKKPHKHESSWSYTNFTMEGVTKWDPTGSKTSTEAYCLYSHGKLLEDHITSFSLVSALEAQLVQSRMRIHELEDEQRLSKKKFETLIRKLGEERNLWYSRKQQKMHAIIEGLTVELTKERKSRKKIDFLNSKLIKELAEAKSFAKQFLQDYKHGKKARELMEEICNELTKKNGEDKAEMELLKSETMRIQREVEEERNMLQLTEVWREERVQMKLIDAKVSLEHKYCQMNKLVAELQSFLRSSAASLNVMALRKAELIRQEVESMNIQDGKEFEYLPSKSDSIFSIFEEVEASANEREMEPMVNYSPICDVSNYHIASPEVNGFDFHNNNVPRLVACNSGSEEDCRVWESTRPAEDQGSGCSIEGSDHLANSSIEDQDYENAGQHSLNTDISDVCSISGQ